MVLQGTNKNIQFSFTPQRATFGLVRGAEKKVDRKEVALTANQINYWALQEDRRHNVMSEGESNRHNVVTEQETARHNVATEQIDISKLAETQRHNQATEGIQLGQLNEQIRHDTETEAVAWSDLGEERRHNLQSEMQAAQNISIERDKVQETIRHNTRTEQVSAAQQAADQAYKESMAAANMMLSSSNANLNTQKGAQIRKQMDELDRQYELAKKRSTRETWNTVFNGANALANLLKGVSNFIQ